MSEFGTGGCESGSVPVELNGVFVGCVGYDSWGGMEDAVQIEKDKTFINLEDVPEGLRFGVLLSGFLRGLEYGSDEYNEASQTGVEWQALLRRYNAGDAGLSDLRDFDGSGLEGWERWNKIYTDTINEESVLDIEVTFGENADIREILRRNGYDDETIDEIFSAEVNSTTGSGLFEGNNVLSNALCEIGYSNCSDWSVQPIDDDGPAVGSGCTDANQREGVIDENGDCQFIVDGQCMKGSVPGTTDASGECITDDGTDGGTGDYSEEEQNTAQAIKDWIEGQIQKVDDITVDDVLGAIFGGDGWDPKCALTGDGEDLWDCTGTDGSEGNQCWKDCVTINVLGGIPGLPMPPGAVDIGTVRDLENTAKEIGVTIESILNPDPDDEGFLEKIKDWVVGKIDDIFGGLDDVTLQDITDWITGTLGNVLGGLILIETENVTNSVTDKIDEILGLPLDPDDDENCIEKEYFEANKEKCTALGYIDCDASMGEANQELTGGIIGPNQTTQGCSEIVDPNVDENGCFEGTWDGTKCVCPPNSDRADLEEDFDGKCSDGDAQTPQEICKDKGLTHDPKNENADEDGCVGDFPDDGTTDSDFPCSEPVSINPYVTYGDRLNTYRNNCPDHCPNDGTLKTDHVNDSCYLSLKEDCQDVNESSTDDVKGGCGYQRCPENTEKQGQLVKDINTDCGETLPDCSEGNINEGNYQQCEKVKCPDGKFNTVDGGSYADSVEDCVGRGDDTPDACPDGTPKANYENGDCDAPCVEGFVKKGSSCVPQCQITGKGDLAASDEGCREDEGPEPEEIDCADLVGLSVEDHEACGHVQCPNDSDKGGRWFPKGSDVEKACYDDPVVEVCVDESGNPTGATNYPDCDLCPRGQQLINNKCQDPTNVDECTDPDANNYGELGDCTYDPEICDDKTATNYGEEGECLYSPIEETCNDPDANNYGELGLCTYDPIEETCNDPEASNYGEEGECLYGPIEEPCNDPEASNYGELGPCTYGPLEETCNDPDANNYGELGPCTYGPILEGCEDPEANNYGQEGPCTYDDPCDSYEYAKDNPLECGWEQCPNGDFAPTREECTDVKDCSDPGYAADNPLECGWVECADGSFAPTNEQCETGPECNDCTCAQYALDNPEECGTSEPPPPDCNDCTCADYAAANPDECGSTPPPPEPPEGGGGGARGMFKPQAAVPPAQGDPALLARTEFPIVDYLAEALAQQTKGELMSGMLTGNIV